MNQQFDKYSGTYERIIASSTWRLSQDGRFHRAKLDCLLDMVPQARGAQKILDFGCGIGGLTGLVANAFPDASVVGCDLSSLSIAAAQQAFRSNRNIEFCNDFQMTNCFDLILAANVFHHIEPPLRAAQLRRLLGVLAPQGRLVVFEHNPYNLLTRLVVSRCPLDEDAVLVTRGAFLRLAQSCGFLLEASVYFLFLPFRTRWTRTLDAWLAKLPLGAQYMISFVAR